MATYARCDRCKRSSETVGNLDIINTEFSLMGLYSIKDRMKIADLCTDCRRAVSRFMTETPPERA